MNLPRPDRRVFEDGARKARSAEGVDTVKGLDLVPTAEKKAAEELAAAQRDICWSCLKRVKINKTIEPKSKQLGWLEKGESIVQMEKSKAKDGTRRVRCEQGWITVKHKKDGKFLVEAEVEGSREAHGACLAVSAPAPAAIPKAAC